MYSLFLCPSFHTYHYLLFWLSSKTIGYWGMLFSAFHLELPSNAASPALQTSVAAQQLQNEVEGNQNGHQGILWSAPGLFLKCLHVQFFLKSRTLHTHFLWTSSFHSPSCLNQSSAFISGQARVKSDHSLSHSWSSYVRRLSWHFYVHTPSICFSYNLLRPPSQDVPDYMWLLLHLFYSFILAFLVLSIMFGIQVVSISVLRLTIRDTNGPMIQLGLCTENLLSCEPFQSSICYNQVHIHCPDIY